MKNKILPYKWSNPTNGAHWVSDVKTAINSLTAILDQSDHSRAFIKQKILILKTVEHLVGDAIDALKLKIRK